MSKSKFIEVKLPLITGGVQLHSVVVCNTKKQAAELLGVSLYYLNNYGYVYEPKTPEAIEQKCVRFAYFDSGWLWEKKPEWYRKVLPFGTLEAYIHEQNKIKYDSLFKKKK